MSSEPNRRCRAIAMRCARAPLLLVCTLSAACDPTRGSPVPEAGPPTSLAADASATATTATTPGLAEPESVSAEADAGTRRAARGGNLTLESFARAKRELARIYEDHRSTLYCDCPFDEHLELTGQACGYQPLKPGGRAARVEWEHVVAAEAFGRSFVEWREGHPDCVDRKGKAFRGRACARKTSPDFRRMEADLYNLYPAIGELNGLRSNFAMAEIEGEDRRFGACDVEIEERKLEPRPAIRGDVARTYQYMSQAYPGRGIVSRKNAKLFEAWSALDPVDDWECERARRIAAVQGNTNPVLQAACAERR